MAVSDSMSMNNKARFRKLKDLFASRLMLGTTVFASLLVVLIAVGLFQKSLPILSLKPLPELLFSSSWYPLKGQFGFWPFIVGTFSVTAVAMVLAIPLCILTSIYLAEYAPNWVRNTVKPAIDLLAGIPSVVYGLCGILVLIPLVRNFAAIFGIITNGYNILTGGIVLAIMVFPVIISISEEVIRNVPYGMREVPVSLGSTKWQATKLVVMRGALPGIIAAIILGFSRAFGETMAVLMVVGNVAKIPSSIFDPAYPLTALIANNYGEMMSIPLYDSALLFAALILLVIVLLFNVGASYILIKVESNYAA
ncbi:MAG: phosphate ABC transporter permease subunit PstC [Dehalococcoidia bacterium]|nr:phosphate ABC transporter permease subunit PstC [Dehalococcoidia bacterium]